MSYHSDQRPAHEVREIIQRASVIFEVPASAIYGPSRPWRIARARQAIYAVATEHGWSCSHVARVLALNHTSIVAGRKAAQNHRRYDPQFDERYQRLQHEVCL